MKTKLLLFVIFLYLVSCGEITIIDEEAIIDKQEMNSRSVDENFNFDEVTKPEVWTQFNSLKEM